MRISSLVIGRSSFALLFLALPALAAPPDNTAYDIKFERASKVGQVFANSQTVELDQTILVTVGGKEVKKDAQKARCALEATVQVLAIDDQGRQSKLHMTIKKLQIAQGDAPLADLIKGDVEIEATYGDNKIDFTLAKSSELSKDAAQALGAFLPPRSADSKVNNDDLMGAKEKKKIGDSWPMDIKLLAPAMGLNPDKTTGNIKLESVKSEAGVKWLNFSQALDASEIKDHQLGTSKEGKVTARGTLSLPTDTANPSEKSTGKREMHGVFEVPQQDGSTAVITADRTESRTSSIVLTGTAPLPAPIVAPIAASQPATAPKK